MGAAPLSMTWQDLALKGQAWISSQKSAASLRLAVSDWFEQDFEPDANTAVGGLISTTVRNIPFVGGFLALGVGAIQSGVEQGVDMSIQEFVAILVAVPAQGA